MNLRGGDRSCWSQWRADCRLDAYCLHLQNETLELGRDSSEVSLRICHDGEAAYDVWQRCEEGLEAKSERGMSIVVDAAR